MKYGLTIGWLYPELMSTYGDRGNIMVLEKRCTWRGIGSTVLPIGFGTTAKDIRSVDLVFGGGAQDRQQAILIDDLRKKGPILKELLTRGVPGLFVCGSPQLLGEYYMTGDRTKLEGLGILDMVSRHFGTGKPRCIGNMVVDIDPQSLPLPDGVRRTMVGFENHGGRTYLGPGTRRLGTVRVGYGNNGEDGSEGAVSGNWIATYSHGPLLSKNPHIADWLIGKALEVKYRKPVPLKPLDDREEWLAHEHMVDRLTR